MSDLRYYRDQSKPLADRMTRAGQDNLESDELDDLLQDFATELESLDNVIAQLNRNAELAEYTDTDAVWSTCELLRKRLTGKALNAPPTRKRRARA